MHRLNGSLRLLAPLAVAATLAACEQETMGADLAGPSVASFDSTFATSTGRTFVQVDRLGNPLTSEVTVEKREHSTFNAFSTEFDAGHFTDDVVAFVTQVAGRSSAYGATVASVLVGTAAAPGDELKVFPGRAAGVTASTAGSSAAVGWLTNVLDPTNGYGGRKLMNDDTVDKGLGVIFGSLAGNTANVTPRLSTDNVPANDKAPLAAFPYFPEPTNP